MIQIKKRIGLLFLVVAWMMPQFIPAHSVQAQGGGGGTCTPPPKDAFGNLILDGLTNAGDPYRECLACVQTPFGPVGIALTFDKYTDADGRFYMMPNFFTSMYMAFTGWTPPFAHEPIDAVVNGPELLAALLGRYENMGGIFALISDLGLTPAQALAITGKTTLDELGVPDLGAIFSNLAADVSFWIRLNLMIMRDAGDMTLRSMVLIYCDDPTIIPTIISDPESGDGTPVPHPTINWTPPATSTPCANCTPTPRPTAQPTPTFTPTAPPTFTPVPTRTPVPTATPMGGCKASSISRTGAGVLVMEKLNPANPIVIGQDETRRGVDIHVRIVSPAVLYTYEKWEVVSTKTQCCHDDPITGWRTCQDDMAPCNSGWAGWSRQTNDTWGCKEYKEVYPDPVDLGTLNVRAILTPGSRQWITTELARRYPGASVKQGDWTLIPPYGWQNYESMAGDTYVLDALLKGIPFMDPGTYEMWLVGRTKGTKYTAPEAFNYNAGTFDVSFIDTALIK